MAKTLERRPQFEAVGRYLGNAFPSLFTHRCEDTARVVAGFSFIGDPHGAAEFRRDFLETPVN